MIFMVLKEITYGNKEYTEFDSEVIFASENRVKAFEKYCDCMDNEEEYAKKEFSEYFSEDDNNGEFVKLDFFFRKIELS